MAVGACSIRDDCKRPEVNTATKIPRQDNRHSIVPSTGHIAASGWLLPSAAAATRMQVSCVHDRLSLQSSCTAGWPAYIQLQVGRLLLPVASLASSIRLTFSCVVSWTGFAARQNRRVLNIGVPGFKSAQLTGGLLGSCCNWLATETRQWAWLWPAGCQYVLT